MTSREYYNSIVAINDIFYESHKILIEKVCIELEQTDKVDELIEKFRGKSDYDCIVPFSGAKDSTFQLYYLMLIEDLILWTEWYYIEKCRK